MARTVIALGTGAISRSLQILIRDAARGGLAGPGGDTILLARGAETVDWARGDTLFEEDAAGFMAREEVAGWRRPLWLATLLPSQARFGIRMAEMLVSWWGPRGSVAGWLGAFGAFHSSRRSDIELAGRYAGMLLEGLVGVRSLRKDDYDALVSSMGSGAQEVFDRWVTVGDAAGFLGILLGGGICPPAGLGAAPRPHFDSPIHASMYLRALDRTEEGALMLTPILDRLRKGLRAGI